MSNIYKNLKDGKPVKSLARITAIIIMVMVWILIDKGNIYGQSISDRDVISKSALQTETQTAQLREGDDIRGDEIPTEDEGDHFTTRPNPVQQDLVFDFEFQYSLVVHLQLQDRQLEQSQNHHLERHQFHRLYQKLH